MAEGNKPEGSTSINMALMAKGISEEAMEAFLMGSEVPSITAVAADLGLTLDQIRGSLVPPGLHTMMAAQQESMGPLGRMASEGGAAAQAIKDVVGGIPKLGGSERFRFADRGVDPFPRDYTLDAIRQLNRDVIESNRLLGRAVQLLEKIAGEGGK